MGAEPVLVPAQARPRRPTARAAAVALPQREARRPARPRRLLGRLAPSRRSLLVALGIVALAGGAYAVARETSLFAIQRVEVRGGSPQVDDQVQRALQPLLGQSLVGLAGSGVIHRAEAVPSVVRADYDRAFPHTLRISIVPERPVAVLRRGPAAWLVSIRGRVVAPLSPRPRPALPRIWLPAATAVAPGVVLGPTEGRAAARAVGLGGAFASRVATASFADGALTFHLRSGIELLLGSPAALRLKLAVAARALPLLPAGTTFLDVSVPDRPVSGSAQPAASNSSTSSGG